MKKQTKDLKELEKMGAIEKISKTKAFKQLLRVDNQIIKELKEDLKDLQEEILENNRLRAKIDKLQLALNIEREWSKRIEADLEILKQWSEAKVEESERKLNLLKKERDKLL